MQVLAHFRVWWRIYSLVLAVLLAMVNMIVWRNIESPRTLTVQVLEVGKGDATVLRTPSGTTILLDAGPDAGILRALGSALPYGQRRIDALIELSTSRGAIGGVPDVLERYEVVRVYRAGDLARGSRLSLGGGVYADVLLPDHARSRATILHLYYGRTSYLIKENLSTNLDSWLTKLDATDGELSADMTIASGTPTGDYVSNGLRIEAI